MTRRTAVWSSLGLCGLVAICCWQMVAAVLDARHFHPQIALASAPSGTGIDLLNPALSDGNPTWIVASTLATRVSYLLIVTVGLATLLSRGYVLHKTLLRVPVSILAVLSGGLAVVGMGGILDRHMDWAVAVLGATPDTLRATAGQDLAIGIGVAIAAAVLNRAMGRALVAERGSTSFGSLGSSHL